MHLLLRGRRRWDIAAEVVSPKDYADRARFNEALLAKLQETGADLQLSQDILWSYLR